MDIRELKFDDNSFDVAIDKGTMNAMMTAKGDVWVNIQSRVTTKGLQRLCRTLLKKWYRIARKKCLK